MSGRVLDVVRAGRMDLLFVLLFVLLLVVVVGGGRRKANVRWRRAAGGCGDDEGNGKELVTGGGEITCTESSSLKSLGLMVPFLFGVSVDAP